MGTTGAPWNIPYADPSDLVRGWPDLSEDVAEAVADGLDAASRVKQVKQVMTTTNFTTSSTTLIDLTGVTVTLVPTNAANRVAMFFMASTTNGDNVRQVFFRFRRDTTDLFEEISNRQESRDGEYPLSMMFDEAVNNLTSRTYSVRTRTSAGSQTILNSSFIVIEYAP
jgi:hypothetical protein